MFKDLQSVKLFIRNEEIDATFSQNKIFHAKGGGTTITYICRCDIRGKNYDIKNFTIKTENCPANFKVISIDNEGDANWKLSGCLRH